MSTLMGMIPMFNPNQARAGRIGFMKGNFQLNNPMTLQKQKKNPLYK